MKIPHLCRTCFALENYGGDEYGCRYPNHPDCPYNDKSARVRQTPLSEEIHKQSARESAKGKDHFTDRYHIPSPF